MIFILKKILPVVLVLALCICCIPSTASATDFSYLDYITNVKVDGELNIVTCEFPANPFHLYIYPELDADNPVSARYKDRVIADFDPFQSYDITIVPSAGNTIYMGNLPDDTEMNLYLDIMRYDASAGDSPPFPIPTWTMDVGAVLGRFNYYDANHQQLKEFTNYDVNTGLFDSTDWVDTYLMTGFLYDNPDQDTPIADETQFMSPVLLLRNIRFDEFATVTFQLQKMEIVFHIDALVLGGQYNEILDVINKKLATQGKQIDKISGALYNTPKPIKPPGSDHIQENIDLEDGLDDLAKFHFDDSNVILYGGVKSAIGQYGNAMVAVSSLLSKFIELPGVSTLIVVAGVVGTSGLFINLAGSVFSSVHNDAKAAADKAKRDEAEAHRLRIRYARQQARKQARSSRKRSGSN